MKRPVTELSYYLMVSSSAESPGVLIQRRLALICVLVGAMMLFIGIQRLVLQINQLKDFRPIAAEVVDRGVRPSGSGRFLPFVTYRLGLDGEVLRTDQLYWHRESLTKEAAEAAITPYAVGTAVTAYYDPMAPEQTFLRLNLAFEPYELTLIGVALFATGLALSVWQSRRQGHLEPMRSRTAPALMGTAIWQLGGAMAWGHYVYAQPKPYPAQAVWMVALYVLLGLMPLVVAVHLDRLQRVSRPLARAP